MRSFPTDTYYSIDPGSLPASWEVVCVGDVIHDIQPGFASGKHNREGVGIPHLRPMNVDRRGYVDLSLLKYVPPRDGPRLRRRDVLFNNTNSPKLVGKTAHIDQDVEWAFSNHMTRLRPPEGLMPEFVAYQLHYLWMSGYFLHRCVKHVNQASISSSALAETVPLVVAPPYEQRRIVEAIEKHFTRLDAAVASLQRARVNLKRYRASVLKVACEGRLVPTEAELARREGRGFEPASALLERISEERRERWEAQGRRRGKYREPQPPDTSNLPALPEGWVWTSIDQCFDVHVGATPSRARPEYWGGDIPWVSSGEVAFARIGQTRETITQDGFKKTNLDLHPTGTILLGMIGEGKTRGQVAILDIEACNNQNSAAIRVSETEVIPEYVYYFLWSEYERVRKRGSGGNQPALNRSRVQGIVFSLPPLAEQRRIVAEVERHLSVFQAAEALVAANLKRADRLRQAILRRAFEGKLVPQDPTDEPASVLLERIRAEREQAGRNTVEARRRIGRQRKTQEVSA